jgi:hypothetical protein
VGLALAADLLGGAALVAGGVTLYFSVLAPSGASPRGSAALPAGVSATATF